MARLALGFEDTIVPADIDGPPELLHALTRFGVAAGAGDATTPPAVAVRAQGTTFHLSGPAYLTPFRVEGLDAAAGSVMAGLAACKALSVGDGLLCIHGAAARVGERCILFLAPFGTGKSSLMAELALLGAEILADDVVLVDLRDLTISGLRIPMRLRHGFVKDARPAMAQWIADRRILGGARYSYLAPEFLDSTPRPLTDIMLLNRATSGTAGAVLETASPGMLVPRILWHNMARHHPASAIARMAGDLAAAARGSVLHFTDAAAAAGQLFRGDLQPASASAPPLETTRRNDLLITRTDRGAIISDDETGRIFEINESAFVILTLLQQVEDDASVLDLLGTVYPDAARAELEADVRRCLRQFADCGLIDVSRAQSFATTPEQPPC